MKKQTTTTTVRNPHNLPTKICAACQRPFTWRKKWERDWENVLYCSDACRRTGRQLLGDDAHRQEPHPAQRK